MNALAFASRKGGAGKSTLAAQLAAHVHRPTRPCMIIDDDPQGSLTLWNELHPELALPLKAVKRNIAHTLKKAKRDGVEWVFIDTPSNNSVSVVEAIETATLTIIPCRPGLFDVDAVRETIAIAQQVRTPYAVVFNAAPPKRREIEASSVTLARRWLAQMEVPVWGGQIIHRASFSLLLTEAEGMTRYDSDLSLAAEISSLWSAIEKSVRVIRGAREKAAMHRVAA